MAPVVERSDSSTSSTTHESQSGQVMPPQIQTPSANASSEEIMLVANHLTQLIHAMECERVPCPIPCCPMMKNILLHDEECDSPMTCLRDYCRPTRKILTHWASCYNRSCSICIDISPLD